MPETRPPNTPETLGQLADAIAQAEHRTAAQIRQDRIVQAWRGKLTARKEQAPPCGLFEQRQEEMTLK